MLRTMKIIIGVLIIFLFLSCVMDYTKKLLNIVNKSNVNIVVRISTDSLLKDSILYFGDKTNIKSNEIGNLYDVPLSNIFYVFFFDHDSVYADIKNKKLNGISKRTFLNKYKISADSLSQNDTLIYGRPNLVDFHRHFRR
jgi:hypothetical protein